MFRSNETLVFRGSGDSYDLDRAKVVEDVNFGFSRDERMEGTYGSRKWSWTRILGLSGGWPLDL